MAPFKHSAVGFGVSETLPTRRHKEYRSNITAQRYRALGKQRAEHGSSGASARATRLRRETVRKLWLGGEVVPCQANKTALRGLLWALHASEDLLSRALQRLFGQSQKVGVLGSLHSPGPMRRASPGRGGGVPSS